MAVRELVRARMRKCCDGRSKVARSAGRDCGPYCTYPTAPHWMSTGGRHSATAKRYEENVTSMHAACAAGDGRPPRHVYVTRTRVP